MNVNEIQFAPLIRPRTSYILKHLAERPSD